MNIVPMKVVIIAVVIWSCCLVAAQEKACSSVQVVCSSVGLLQSTPGRSCKDIYQFNKARVSTAGHGNYWINTTTGVQEVYCDMELECGGHKGGWMRIADLNTSRGDDCPSGWTNITNPVAACIAPNDSPGCYSTYFPTLSIPYSKVCGMAVGYQKGTTDGFRGGATSINNPYVDGISITHGNATHPYSRKHIWTYAIGLGSGDSNNSSSNCPCSQFPGRSPAFFVHENYYCESSYLYLVGRHYFTNDPVYGHYFTSDPVWDGKDCFSFSDANCCSDLGMPWFYRQIPVAINDDVETRICRDEPSSNEDILITEFQLYVQ